MLLPCVKHSCKGILFAYRVSIFVRVTMKLFKLVLKAVGSPVRNEKFFSPNSMPAKISDFTILPFTFF